MKSIERKFLSLATDNAPGQEVRQKSGGIEHLMQGGLLLGPPVDFSHGDVDAFVPTPGSLDAFVRGVSVGGSQAYTEYRGSADIRRQIAGRLESFTGAYVSSDDGLIITPGTQGALFLAMASTISDGDKVAIVEPDYFANRKLVQFLGGELTPVRLDYIAGEARAGLDLDQLTRAFAEGVSVFVFSNPNNPTGAVYSKDELYQIATLAERFGVTVIVDQLYSRLLYSGVSYSHLRAAGLGDEKIVTLMGPSKTESLSGYRLGVAFGAPSIIQRMEKLQAIVSLRAGGYNQSILRNWFDEPEGWMEDRIRKHQSIRDDLLAILRRAGIKARTPQAGSYLFPRLPELSISNDNFVRLLRHQAAVIVTPGAEFGPHSSTSVRLNFSQEHSKAVGAVGRLVEMVERYGK